MKGSFKKEKRRGLPGGPNEMFTYTTGVFSTKGYKANSPDVDNPFNIIPSGDITMDGVEFPVHGVDNLGNSSIMLPGNDYEFPGDMVFERPMQDLSLKSNPSRKEVLGYGFAFPEQRERNFIAGAGVNFLPIGTQFSAVGVLPMQSNPVFKGVGSLNASKQVGDFNIGIGANKDFLNDYETGQRLDTPIKPSFNVKYTKRFHEGGEPGHEHPWEIQPNEYKSEKEYKAALAEYNAKQNMYNKDLEKYNAFQDLNLKYSNPSKWEQIHGGTGKFVNYYDDESYLNSGSDRMYDSLTDEIAMLNAKKTIAQLKDKFGDTKQLMNNLVSSGYLTEDQMKAMNAIDLNSFSENDLIKYFNKESGYINTSDFLRDSKLFKSNPFKSTEIREGFFNQIEKEAGLAGKPRETWTEEEKAKHSALIDNAYGTNSNWETEFDTSPEHMNYVKSRDQGELKKIEERLRYLDDNYITDKYVKSGPSAGYFGNVQDQYSNTTFPTEEEYLKAVEYTMSQLGENYKPTGWKKDNKYYKEKTQKGVKTRSERVIENSDIGSLSKDVKVKVKDKFGNPVYVETTDPAYYSGNITPQWSMDKPASLNLNKPILLNDEQIAAKDLAFDNEFVVPAEEAFARTNQLEQEIAQDQYMLQNPEMPKGYSLVKGYRDDLYGKTIGDRYVYTGSEDKNNYPDIPVGPTMKDYQTWQNTKPNNKGSRTISASFQDGGEKLYTDRAEFEQAMQMYNDSLTLNTMTDEYNKVVRNETNPDGTLDKGAADHLYEYRLEEAEEAWDRLNDKNKIRPGSGDTVYRDKDGNKTFTVVNFDPPKQKPIYDDSAEKDAAAAKAKAAAKLKAKQEKFSSIEGSVLPVVMAEDTTDLRGYKFRTKYGEEFVPIEDKDTLDKYVNLYGLELPKQQQGGEELSYEDKLKQARYKIDDDGEGYYESRYSLPEVEITYDKNTGDALPYYSYLSPSQKQWLETHQGANDPITRSIRSQAKEGYGEDGNPTYMQSLQTAGKSIAGFAPITALNALSVPQALMVEHIEQLKGNPYDYSKAFDISPLSNTVDQGLFYTDQRFPSETMLDEDSPFAAKLALDVLADPTNLIPAKALGTVAKGASAAAKYKQLLKAIKVGEDVPAATLKLAERQAIKEYQSSISPFAKSTSQIEKKVSRWIPGEKWHDAINPFMGKKLDNMKEELLSEKERIQKNISAGNREIDYLYDTQNSLNSWQQSKRYDFAQDFEDLANKNQVSDYLERKLSQYPDPFEIGEARNAQKKITRELENTAIKLDPEGAIVKLHEPAESQLIYEAADAVRLTPKPNKPIIDFTTGQTYTPKNLNPTAGSKKYTLVDGKVESELVSEGSKRIGFDEGLSNVYSKNENFIKEQMPGFYPMGSSQYHKFGVSHVTDDFDGIIKAEDWNKIKGNFQNVGDSKYGNTVSVRNPDLPGNPKVGEVDVNVIYTNSKTGKAEGGLATELYRQFFPDEFYKANTNAIKKGPGTPITINKTADEILEVYDPEIKSILDTFEAGALNTDAKLKHINKIDYITEAGDPKKVLKAQELYAKSIMGGNADLGRRFSPQAFSDYENNLEILNAIKNAPNSRTNKTSYVPKEIAKDPAKMQIALNDFYLNSSIYTRRVNATHEKINSYDDILDAYKTWISDGGEAMGAGLNAVKLGEPGLGYGSIVGNRQFKLYDSSVSETPLDYIQSVTDKVSGSRTITKADKETIIQLAKKNNINLPENTRIEKFGDLLDIRAHAIGLQNKDKNIDEIGSFLKNVGEEFGMKTISRDNFGNSEYATVLGNIDDTLDKLALSISDYTPPLKSAKQRAENLRNVERKLIRKVSQVDIDSFAKYKAVEGYLDGGLEVALKRQKELEAATQKAMWKQSEVRRELQSLYVEKKLKQFNEKDGQLVKLTEDVEQANKILDGLYNEKHKNIQVFEDLRLRQARLKSMRTNLMAAGIIGGTSASAAAFMGNVDSKSRVNTGSNQYIFENRDSKIKELRNLYPDEPYAKLHRKASAKLYNEFKTLSDEEKGRYYKLYDERKNKLYDERKTKYQLGGDVALRDNTYVDIKAPQLYEAPIDNTRVEKDIVPEPTRLAKNIDFEGLRKGIAQAESLGGTLMINPESTATGLYGQRFSEIEDFYKGTREDFSKDTTYQNELFKKRFYEGLKDTKTTALQKDAMDLYDEYRMQIDEFPYSYEDIAALSNFLGRQGTREYFGYVVRDGKKLKDVFPTKYGTKAKQANKTPEEYLKITRPYYTKSGGGEILKVYADYINGVLDDTPMYKKGGRIYDKLNRIYYKDAKAVGMSSPNYIMSYLVN